jgi:hypothetical protein
MVTRREKGPARPTENRSCRNSLGLKASTMMLVSKSELALELGISAPRVSQFIAIGLPVRGDGQVDLAEACRWVLANIDPGKDSPSVARSNAAEWLYLLRRESSAK